MSISICVSLIFFVLVTSFSDAFAPPSSPIRTLLPLLASKESLQLTTNLSPAEIGNLATTPNHSELKSGTWVEYIPAEKTCVRYIVEGGGSIALTSANGETIRRRISPGSLVEIKGDGGESQLVWDVDDEMVLLYSGEPFNELQQVAIGLLGLLGLLIGAGHI